ncbi:MAG: MFS transporter [Pseudomonadota bacterium]
MSAPAQPPARSETGLLSPTGVIIAAGAVVLSLSFGVRSVFGIVLEPMSTEFAWPREVFSLSLAIQNMVWGLAQPFFGALADKYGDRWALWLGLGLYCAGMALAAVGYLPIMQHLGAGVLVGMGVAGTAFGLVLSVVGRAVPEERRAKALALTAALGSFGQMAMPLLAGWLTSIYGWQATLIVMGLLLLPIGFCIPFLKAETPAGSTADPEVTIGTMLRRAFGHSSYVLLTLGFFVCGFHVAFMTAHLPVYVAEVCGSVTLGAATLSVIGLANVFGTLLAGQLASYFPKPYILSAIYALRAVVITLFIFVIPPTPVSMMVFSAMIGVLWLSTVPLTSGLVATMFGTRALGTLYGIVFLSHQVGSFLGVWIGGRAYDATGSYDTVWIAAVVLGVFSALVHLPVRDRPWSAQPA